jgi:mono/diheme cytochrome c family protein
MIGVVVLLFWSILLEPGPVISPAPAWASAQESSASGPGSPAQVYLAACLQCHDSDGRGGCVRDALPNIPDFTNPRWHDSRPDEDLRRSILHGKGRAMSPMKNKLGSVDVMQMVSFIRCFRGGAVVVTDGSQSPSATPGDEASSVKPGESSPGPNPPASRPSEGRPVRPEQPLQSDETAMLFRQLCSGCHGRDGRGRGFMSVVPGVPDFSSRPWQRAKSDAQLAASILEGKGRLMPAWGRRLGSDKARELVAFVRTLGPPARDTGEIPASEFRRRFRTLQRQWEQLDGQAKALDRLQRGAGP